MIRSLLIFSFFLLSFSAPAQLKSSQEVVDAMLKKYSGKMCKTLTFAQNTFRPNDSLNTHMTWYEAIEYPDKYRIDFNSITKGNSAVFRNDTAFRFRKGVLQDTRVDKNDLLLLLGGMYFRTAEENIKRLSLLGYNLEHFSENTWRNRPVYVIGVLSGDTLNNQIWVDKQDLKIVRTRSHLSPMEVLEMRVEASTKTCGGYTDTKLSFYINGKLDQQEEYAGLQTGMKIDPGAFDPRKFGTSNWPFSRVQPAKSATPGKGVPSH
jgi:hypothetical protein